MRNNSIDIAKGIGIILVVLGHNWLVLHDKGELFRIIFSFHMPLFFFLSGTFLNPNEKPKKFFIAKADSLLKPYFVVLFALGLKSAIGEAIQNNDVVLDFRYFGGVLYASSETIPWVPLWFLPHLFIALAASYFLIRLTTKKPHLRIIIASFILFIGAYHLTFFWHDSLPHATTILPGLPWSADLAFVTVPYVLTGQLLSKRTRNINFNAKHFCLALLLFTCAHALFNETIDFNQRSYGDPLISTIQASLGIYLCLSLSRILSEFRFIGKWLAYIGQGTLFILIFHSYFQDKFFKLAPYMPNNQVAAFSGFAAGIIAPILILELTKRLRLLSLLLLPQKYNFLETKESRNSAKAAVPPSDLTQR